MKFSNTKPLLAIVALAALSSFGVAAGNRQSVDEFAGKPWMFRFRLLNMQPLNHSDAFSALSTNFASNAIRLNSKWFPEFDFSYFFNDTWSAELVLTYPQMHDVTLDGVGNIGTVTHLPPCLLGQYHFNIPNSNVRPYVGVGVNFTRITAANLSVAGTALDVKRDSFGLAFQLGADIKIGPNMFLNVDYKRVNIGTNVYVSANGAHLAGVRVDPNLFSFGIGFRF